MSEFSYNYLPDNTYKIIFSSMPNLTFYTQEFTMPSLSIPTVESGFPGNNYKSTSGQLSIDDVTISFILDENMAAYFEIYDWLKKINQYSGTQQPPLTYSDITVLPFNATSSSIAKRITLRDCFPNRLGQLTFRTTSGDTEYLVCDASFAVTDIEVR